MADSAGDRHRCTHEGTAGAHAGRHGSEHDERVRPGDASPQALFFDGKSLFTADDETFKDAGKIGLWTKADSVTYFDDLRFASHDAK